MDPTGRTLAAALGTGLSLAWGCIVVSGCTVGNSDLGAATTTSEAPATTVAELGEATSSAAPIGPHWEAVLLGGSASLLPSTGDPGDSVDGPVLRIDAVDEDLTMFSDRPERLSGTIAMHELLTLWAGGAFRSDPPNAAVVSGDEVIPVELTGALWDPGSSTVWFSTRPIGAGPAPHWNLGADRTQLFIDGFAVPTQVTDSVTQANVKILGQAPAMAMGSLYQTIAESISLDTTTAQGAAYSLGQTDAAESTAGVSQILGTR